MEQWYLYKKKADFNQIGEKFNIDPVIARLIRNRDVIGEEAIERYLNGTISDLYAVSVWRTFRYFRSFFDERRQRRS